MYQVLRLFNIKNIKTKLIKKLLGFLNKINEIFLIINDLISNFDFFYFMSLKNFENVA